MAPYLFQKTGGGDNNPLEERIRGHRKAMNREKLWDISWKDSKEV